MEYRHLMKDNQCEKVWQHSSANKLGRLSREVGKIVMVTDTIFFVDYKDIPSERREDITYGCIVLD